MKRLRYAVLMLLFLFIATSGQTAGIHDDLKEALANANKAGKILLVDFYGGWCPWCVKMDETFANAEIKTLIQDKFYYYKLDVGQFDRHTECLRQYKINGIPYIIVFNSEGGVLISQSGYQNVSNFKSFLMKAVPSTGLTTSVPSTGLTVYALEDFNLNRNPVSQAVRKAAGNNQRLILYFYEKNTEQHAAIEDILAKIATTEPSSRFAILRIAQADHTDIAIHYGCQSAPFLIVFRKDGTVCSFFQKAMNYDELLSAMMKALK